jgi:glycosyltransferase involved in cell wall biosynthesis
MSVQRMEGAARAPRFSLIIPAYNEEAYLPRLLDSVDGARARYGGGGGGEGGGGGRGGADAVEVVVADNMSSDGTARVATERGCRVARVEKRAIAAARNGGARIARGAVFAFGDADARIHPETFNEIERALATGKVVGGATGVRLERWSLGLAVTWLVFLPLVWLTGLDTGVVFCRREDFEAVGGYNEGRLFAEDVEFLFALRRQGKRRRQRLVRLRRAKAIASTRKFDEHGEWHYFTDIFAKGIPALLAGRPAEELARKYWYDVRRGGRKVERE